jgi:hypothetical protein
MQVNEAKRHPDARLELSVALQVRGYILQKLDARDTVGCIVIGVQFGEQ